jgi:1,4-alpha-glucan branching enzyme
MRQLMQHFPSKSLDEHIARIVHQCGRELLLLQSSDWPFMISTGSTVDHARQRFSLHYNNFQWCRSLAERSLAGATPTAEEWRLLEEMEEQNTLFPHLDLSIFQKNR